MSSRTLTVVEAQPQSFPKSANNDLGGVVDLTRFVLRRERKRLTIWLAVMTVLLLLFDSFISDLTSTTEGRNDMMRFMDGATGALFGPGYGRFDITASKYLAGVYSSFFYMPLAFITINLIARHTRAEEQNGHAELIRSNAVGRSAPLTAALAVAVGFSAAMGLLIGTVMTSLGHTAADSYLFGASVAAVGLVFAGISTVTVQLNESSRTVAAYAGGFVGLAWVIRMLGDMLEEYGSPLSWVSPLAWTQQTRPFVDGRWWPLLLSVAVAVGTAAVGFRLLSKRDIGAGIIASRPGTPEAAPWLKTALALAYRLLRGSILWWTIGLVLTGFVFGAMGDEVANPENISADRVEMFGGSLETVFEGFLGVLAQFMAILTTVMLVKGVSVMRQEETGGRVEPLLATAVSKTNWFVGYMVVMVGGGLLVLLSSGLALGLGAALVMEDSSFIADGLTTHLAYAPAVLLSLGLAYVLFGYAPRFLGFAWAPAIFGFVAAFFARTLDLPSAVTNLSPFEHVGSPLVDGVSIGATLVLSAIGALLVAIGFEGFRRRDLAMK